MVWQDYLVLLAAAGTLVDHDWRSHVKRRGFGALRLPHVTKGWE
jgi:hypothetical protein